MNKREIEEFFKKKKALKAEANRWLESFLEKRYIQALSLETVRETVLFSMPYLDLATHLEMLETEAGKQARDLLNITSKLSFINDIPPLGRVIVEQEDLDEPEEIHLEELRLIGRKELVKDEKNGNPVVSLQIILEIQATSSVDDKDINVSYPLVCFDTQLQNQRTGFVFNNTKQAVQSSPFDGVSLRFVDPLDFQRIKAFLKLMAMAAKAGTMDDWSTCICKSLEEGPSGQWLCDIRNSIQILADDYQGCQKDFQDFLQKIKVGSNYDFDDPYKTRGIVLLHREHFSAKVSQTFEGITGEEKRILSRIDFIHYLDLDPITVTKITSEIDAICYWRDGSGQEMPGFRVYRAVLNSFNDNEASFTVDYPEDPQETITFTDYQVFADFQRVVREKLEEIECFIPDDLVRQAHIYVR